MVLFADEDWLIWWTITKRNCQWLRVWTQAQSTLSLSKRTSECRSMCSDISPAGVTRSRSVTCFHRLCYNMSRVINLERTSKVTWDIAAHKLCLCSGTTVWARERCRISPPHFLEECHKRRLNQGSFVLLCFALFACSGLCLVCVLSVFVICLLSC